MLSSTLMVVPPPNNDTWPEVYIYQALIQAGGANFMALPSASSVGVGEYTEDAHQRLMVRFATTILSYQHASEKMPEALLHTEAYTALPTYYRSVEPMLKDTVKFHAALVHGGSFIPGDVMAWPSLFEEEMLKQYDLLIAPSEYHKALQEDKYLNLPITVVSRWPLNVDVLDHIPRPRSERHSRIVFPHRQIPEKGWDLFEHTRNHPDRPANWQFAPTGKRYPRGEYLTLLGDSKAVFASATMETYGVAVEEAMALGCCPVLNNHRVYWELYKDCQVHWHAGTEESVLQALAEVETCTITHYVVDAEVNHARAERILTFAEGNF